MVKVRQREGKREVWDFCRRRWVRLTPEEGVRQWLVERLVESGVEPQRIATEVGVEIGGRMLRMDVVVYDVSARAVMICECKAPEVRVDNSTFMQAADYNRQLRVPYLLVSNGTQTYCARVDDNGFEMLEGVPAV